MTTTTKRAAMMERIEKHGRQLLAIFPNAVEQDPVKLCKRLRRIEAKGAAFALRLCNGPEFPTETAADRVGNSVLAEADTLLRFGPVKVFLNRDPRGYALKIDSDQMRGRGYDLHRDWGGYGIIAPDLTDEN